MTKKWYTHDPYPEDQTIYYCYDNVQSVCTSYTVNNGIGHRTGMLDASGNTAWSYDVVGRLRWKAKTIAGQYNGIEYSYNLDSSLSSILYPDVICSPRFA